MEEGFVDSNGIRMHYVAQGEGPPVVLLHGFPEHWYVWRHQLRGLAEAGLRAIAPDLRGYGQSDRPAGGYDLDSLVADVAGLAAGLGLERFALVGHDWGGPIAWAAAMRLGGVERLAQLNGPHPRIYMRNLLTSRQFLLSWYIYVFQVPGLAERLLRRRDHAAIRYMFTDGQRRAPDTITDEDVARLTDAMRGPGAIEAGLRYYRQIFKPKAVAALRRMRPVEVPTLVVWGLKERALVPETEAQLARWVNAPLQVHYLPDAGHWLGEERPEQVNRLLVDFLRA